MDKPDTTAPEIKGTPLTPLQLNAVKLDVRHTLLTPTYLEEMIREKTSQP